MILLIVQEPRTKFRMLFCSSVVARLNKFGIVSKVGPIFVRSLENDS
jgi:hypothetical protein